MPHTIGTVVQQVLKQTQKKQSALFEVQRKWSRLVGKPLALHTRPVSLRQQRLIVHVERSGDGFILHYQRGKLLKRLARLTEGKVEELVIRVGEASRAKTKKKR